MELKSTFTRYRLGCFTFIFQNQLFVRQRRRLTKSLEEFIMDHPNIRMDNIEAIFNGEFNDEYPPSVREWIQNWKTSDQDLIKEATELSFYSYLTV